MPFKSLLAEDQKLTPNLATNWGFAGALQNHIVVMNSKWCLIYSIFYMDLQPPKVEV